MSEKILIIPWDDNEVVQMLEIILADLGFTSIVLNTLINQIELVNIEKACLAHQPKVLLTHFFEVGHPHNIYGYGFGETLCKMVRENSQIHDISLLYFFTPDYPNIHEYRGRPIPCFVDKYLNVPFSIKELEKTLKYLVTK